MKQYTIALSSEVQDFYERIAENAGLSVERVLSDALFRFAGEVSVQLMQQSCRTEPYMEE